MIAICLSGAVSATRDDVRAGGLVTGQVELVERGHGGVGQRHATTREQALLDGRLRVANGVLDAVLALLELDLGRRADLDDRNTAGELRQPLLQLLAVVVGVAASRSRRGSG